MAKSSDWSSKRYTRLSGMLSSGECIRECEAPLELYLVSSMPMGSRRFQQYLCPNPSSGGDHIVHIVNQVSSLLEREMRWGVSKAKVDEDWVKMDNEPTEITTLGGSVLLETGVTFTTTRLVGAATQVAMNAPVIECSVERIDAPLLSLCWTRIHFLGILIA